MTTAKLDATGHRWLAALGAFNFSIHYRPGSRNGDADGLSRRPLNESRDDLVTLDPSVLKAVCQCHRVDLPHQKAELATDPLAEAIAMGQGAVPKVY